MKVVFLDRDGVINKYPGDTKYVTTWKEFKFLPKSIEAIKVLNKEGFKIFVVSNQAGVRKGIYSHKALDIITENMLKKIKKLGGKINEVLYCTHTDEDECACRKPKTGLIQEAFKMLKVKPALKNTYFIGDSIRDIQTGKNAGLKTILVLSGKDKLSDKRSWQYQPDYIAKDLFSATNIILNENSRSLRLGRNRP